ncbi:MAG TPA: hypothetical protein PKC18_14820 [Lacipirellulaceae bacterium]|nr:hypothetical protein [Lacipirellulaceae bacterium]
MSTISHPSPLERLLEPLASGMTSDMAKYIVEFRADESVQSRIAELAEKANEGDLTDDERVEYERFVDGGTLIAILQAQARRRLTDQS